MGWFYYPDVWCHSHGRLGSGAWGRAEMKADRGCCSGSVNKTPYIDGNSAESSSVRSVCGGVTRTVPVRDRLTHDNVRTFLILCPPRLSYLQSLVTPTLLRAWCPRPSGRHSILGLFGYFVLGGSPTSVLANYPSRSCNDRMDRKDLNSNKIKTKGRHLADPPSLTG